MRNNLIVISEERECMFSIMIIIYFLFCSTHYILLHDLIFCGAVSSKRSLCISCLCRKLLFSCLSIQCMLFCVHWIEDFYSMICILNLFNYWFLCYFECNTLESGTLVILLLVILVTLYHCYCATTAWILANIDGSHSIIACRRLRVRLLSEIIRWHITKLS